jgi:hypothetical protein
MTEYARSKGQKLYDYCFRKGSRKELQFADWAAAAQGIEDYHIFESLL